MLKAVKMARLSELGHLAAFEYEKVCGDTEDYLISVKRYYNRTSVISTLKPTLVFLKVDP